VVRDRILIIEDHELLASCLAAALTARGARVRTLDPSRVDAPLAHALERPVDLALLDLDLGPFGDGTALVGPLRRAGVVVVAMTGLTDPVRHARCVQAGAVGVVPKSGAFDDLVAAVDKVRATGSLLDDHQRQELLAVLRSSERAAHERLEPYGQLTPREAEVLRALMDGSSVEMAARRAGVSVATVRSQVRAVLTKLGVRSQTAAVARAYRDGWPADRSAVPAPALPVRGPITVGDLGRRSRPGRLHQP
jgi:two-component system, NarL family, nitrate/nitrite response regulator NarL